MCEFGLQRFYSAHAQKRKISNLLHAQFERCAVALLTRERKTIDSV